MKILRRIAISMLSLVNSAKKQLILSAPSLLNENESKESIYLKELQDFGFTKIEKRIDRRNLSKDDIGSYHSLLSSLVAYHQQGESETSEQDLTFIKVLARVMGRKLEDQGLDNPVLPTSPKSKTLDTETLEDLVSSRSRFLSINFWIDRVLSKRIQLFPSICLRFTGRIASET